MNVVPARKMYSLNKAWSVSNKPSLETEESPRICDAEPDAIAAIQSSHSCGPWLVAGELEAGPH